MNQRIRELALQAGIDFFNSTDPEFSGREYCEAWTEQQQKFAELIVQECADVADDPDTDMLRVGQAIREHFGVGE